MQQAGHEAATKTYATCRWPLANKGDGGRGGSLKTSVTQSVIHANKCDPECDPRSSDM